MFFSFYWLKPGFHLANVLVGLVVLLVIMGQIMQSYKQGELGNEESNAAFRHLFDLIWLMLFSSIYLLSWYE